MPSTHCTVWLSCGFSPSLLLFASELEVSFFLRLLLGRRQKKRIFYGQADRKRLPHPPSYGQLFVKFFWCVFYLRLWFYVFWNGFYTRKVIFIQLQEFPTPPYCRCCSVTKRSDSGIAEALKALKMHFRDPSQWDEMRGSFFTPSRCIFS